MKKRKQKTLCNKILVDKNCCGIKFIKDQSKLYAYSEDIGDTIRGEQVTIDRDKNGKILSIELICLSMKPCMQPLDLDDDEMIRLFKKKS